MTTIFSHAPRNFLSLLALCALATTACNRSDVANPTSAPRNLAGQDSSLANPGDDAADGEALDREVVHSDVVESVLAASAAADSQSEDSQSSDRGVQTVAYNEPLKEKFDPVAENGKFFDGWKKPKLAIVISGRQDGYLEPCGCAGLNQQKGGMSRRHSLIKQLQAQGWPVAAVDVGGLVRRFGKQAEIQFAISADALKLMGYGAVGFGPSDLRLSAGEIVAAVAGADPKDSLFVSANVDLFGLTPKFRILEAGGMRIGVTSVLGKEFKEQINNAEVAIQPAAESLRTVMPELKDCDVRILLSHATLDEKKQQVLVLLQAFQRDLKAKRQGAQANGEVVARDLRQGLDQAQTAFRKLFE